MKPLCLRNVPNLAYYNYNIHPPISTFLPRTFGYDIYIQLSVFLRYYLLYLLLSYCGGNDVGQRTCAQRCLQFSRLRRKRQNLTRSMASKQPERKPVEY